MKGSEADTFFQCGELWEVHVFILCLEMEMPQSTNQYQLTGKGYEFA